MQRVVAEAKRAARFKWPILIEGPTGSGKEVVAQLIAAEAGIPVDHWVPANCAGLPRDLVESELFGSVKGSFTSSTSNRLGLLRASDGGILFLDEIGELTLDAQPKLLRAIEEKKVRPVGSEQQVSIDLRLVCATNRSLRQMVEKGSFRDDLYYRISDSVISIPPLYQRPEDIVPLFEHFVSCVLEDAGLSFMPIDNSVVSFLHEHMMKLNSRLLRRLARRAVMNSQDESIDADLLCGLLGTGDWKPRPLKELMKATEAAVIRYALRGRTTKQAASLLGMGERSLRSRKEVLKIKSRSIN